MVILTLILGACSPETEQSVLDTRWEHKSCPDGMKDDSECSIYELTISENAMVQTKYRNKKIIRSHQIPIEIMGKDFKKGIGTTYEIQVGKNKHPKFVVSGDGNKLNILSGKSFEIDEEYYRVKSYGASD